MSDFESLPFEQVIESILFRLDQQSSHRPAFTLLLGAGFSAPLIPTAGFMVAKDIAWWLYRKKNRESGLFPYPPDHNSDLQQFEIDLWTSIHSRSDGAFRLQPKGLPDLSDATQVGAAYQAIMSGRSIRGLSDPQTRRQYLRDVGKRSGNKVNGAHIYLGSILQAQDTWRLGSPFCRTIFTTNFDPLLQRSLQLVNKLYYMTDRPDTIEPPEDDESEAIHLIYSHGSLHRYLLLNTEHEIQSAREMNASSLVPYLQRHGVIVVGYSGWRDSVMAALLQCKSFDGNLYWCDVHSPENAKALLNPTVITLLTQHRDTAFYVPISGADEALLSLHKAMGLGDAPPFILNPLSQMIGELRSIDVSEVRRGSARVQNAVDTFKNILDRTIKRLVVAQQAFEEPLRLAKSYAEWPADPRRTKDLPDLEAAITAQRMNSALLALQRGDTEEAIRLWTLVADDNSASPEERTTALNNRSVAYWTRGDHELAIRDYDTVLATPNAPYNQKARALANRAWSCYERPDPDLARFVKETAEALKIDPNLILARFNLGLGYLLTRMVEDAKKEYEIAANLCENGEDVYHFGILDLEQALSREGELPGGREILAMLLRKKSILEHKGDPRLYNASS
jgi:tetratricopeptide (TPR) repeat protein